MPDAAQKALKARLPFASPRNPVDVTAQAFNDMSLVEANMKIMLEQGGYDAILAFWTSVAGSPIPVTTMPVIIMMERLSR